VKHKRDINDFKKGYQPRNNIVEDEKCDLFADSHRVPKKSPSL
jgi:hypothetical protein